MIHPLGTRQAGFGLALVLASGIASGCGDSLSSLEVVNRKVYGMTLDPDFGCKGQDVTPKATLDQPLVDALTESESYPSEMSFGDDTVFKKFDVIPEGANRIYQLSVFISPQAREGTRHPTLVFVTEDRSYEALGTFTVLAAGVCR